MPTPSTQPQHVDIETRAYHEAGHAVAAVACGIPYKRVTIIAGTSKDGGRVELDSSKILRELRAGNADLYFHLCVLCHAGLIAQLLKRPESPSWTADEDGRYLDELLKAMPYRLYVYHKDTDSFTTRTPAQRRRALLWRNSQARRSAGRIVVRLWPAVEIIAKRLVRKKTLKRQEVDAIVKPMVPFIRNKEGRTMFSGDGCERNTGSSRHQLPPVSASK